jgi:hypothetical protein
MRMVRLRWPFSRVTVLSPTRSRTSAIADSGTCMPLEVLSDRLPSVPGWSRLDSVKRTVNG